MSESGERIGPEHDLGVLFVHGIGRQRQGDTLAEWGDAIIEWMRRWFGEHHDVLTGDNAGDASDRLTEEIPHWQEAWYAAGDEPRTVMDRTVALKDACREESISRHPNDPRPVRGSGTARYASVLGAELRPEPGMPAHAKVRVGVLGGGAAEERSWILAESHWADQFTAPSFREMVSWSFLGAPFALASHFGTCLRRDLETPGVPVFTVVRHMLLHLMSILLAPLVIAFLIATIVLALIPLPLLRAPFRRTQMVVSQFLGDCYALVERPTSSAAIQARVLSDLHWLARHCQRVVIIAHSQGAAATYLALRNGFPSQLDRVVTLGSGLRKLHELEVLRGSSVTRWLAAAVPLGGALLALAVLRGDSGLTAWLGAGLLALVFGSFPLSQARTGLLEDWFSILKRRGVTWKDYYASKDPVSNGPLLDPSESEAFENVESTRVDNTGSVLLDHVSYWENTDECVSRVVAELCAIPGAAPASLLGHDRLSFARVSARRRVRTNLRGLLTWSLALGGAAEVASRLDSWADLARRCGDRLLLALPQGGWPGATVEQVPKADGAVVTFPPELLESTVGALVIYMGFFVLAQIGWWTWNRSQVAGFFKGRNSGLSWSSLALFALPAATLVPLGVGHLLERRAPFFEPVWLVSLAIFIAWLAGATIVARRANA